ncbi:hypothetical protein Ddc_12939 [Ditylenchus destructor]|nr:hypothetical protein Ddc_12939 [Ditylenchus destructor]
MNRSTFLLFICVFASSEMLLAATTDYVPEKKTTISRMLDIQAVFGPCPNDTQCEEFCKYVGGIADNSQIVCACAVTKPWTKERCDKGCRILGIGGAWLSKDKKCFCRMCEPGNGQALKHVIFV